MADSFSVQNLRRAVVAENLWNLAKLKIIDSINQLFEQSF